MRDRYGPPLLVASAVAIVLWVLAAVGAEPLASMAVGAFILGGLVILGTAAGIWAWNSKKLREAIDERRDPTRPRMDELAPKPRKPHSPSKPQRKERHLVRSYSEKGLNSGKKNAEAYQKDASKLAAQGYEPMLSASQGANPANILLGGIGLLAPGTLTVTFKLTDDAIRREEEAERVYRLQVEFFNQQMSAYQLELAKWERDRTAARSKLEIELADWREARRAAKADADREGT